MSGVIVVDTSAIMSIGLDEADAHKLLQILMQSERILMAAPSKLELGIVGINRNIYPRAMQLLDTFAVEVVAFDDALSIMAIKAFESYGKGRHKAALNFGDCCAYALAKSLGLPLLYKGDDFAQTDIASAI